MSYIVEDGQSWQFIDFDNFKNSSFNFPFAFHLSSRTSVCSGSQVTSLISPSPLVPGCNLPAAMWPSLAGQETCSGLPQLVAEKKYWKRKNVRKMQILHSFYSLVDFPSVDLLVASFIFSLSSLVMSRNIDRVFWINLKYQKIFKKKELLMIPTCCCCFSSSHRHLWTPPAACPRYLLWSTG